MHLDERLPRSRVMLPVSERLQEAARQAGVQLDLITGPPEHPLLAFRAVESSAAPAEPEGYTLIINATGVFLHYRDQSGLRAGVATLRQLIREFGRRLPRLVIRDYPDFPRRGVMLDVSRGRVPNLQTLLNLVEHLADFKINEFQLYTEHTFAYRNYEPVWREWGPLTGDDILKLDARCRELGIDLVPNQNSFGHLRYWLEHSPLRRLAEVKNPYEGVGGTFLRYPATLAPNNPGTLPFVRGLFDELLPHFTSSRFNVGCDETWDLGRGQSKAACERIGKERVYLNFVKQIYGETTERGKQMMFWGDIILNHPKLIKELPRDLIALNWGYEADHPFEKETGLFAESGIPFYVCPGTGTWMTLIGRHDNAFANLSAAAKAGLKNGAVGYLNTDWGDGGHPQPLAVSWLPYALGAAVSWCGESFEHTTPAPHNGARTFLSAAGTDLLIHVLSRDIFDDPTQRTARAAFDLGFAHRKFEYSSPNVTPFGTVITAPPPPRRELVCRDGLKYYARIPQKQIRAAMEEAEEQRAVLYRGTPTTHEGELLACELDMAARMAIQSGKIMLWQQALAASKTTAADRMARQGIRELTELEHDFEVYWPLRNKGTTAKCSPFLKWRINDYRRRALFYPPDVARLTEVKTYAAE
jgi:hexosaminidase